MSQGNEDHIIIQEANMSVVVEDRCTIIKCPIAISQSQNFASSSGLQTCYKLWNQAKSFYTNGMQHFYKDLDVRQQ